MIRIIVREAWDNPEGQIVANQFKTFDVDHPALEKLLGTQRAYVSISVIGAEVLPSPGDNGGSNG